MGPGLARVRPQTLWYMWRAAAGAFRMEKSVEHGHHTWESALHSHNKVADICATSVGRKPKLSRS
jgi:hypothetical protein